MLFDAHTIVQEAWSVLEDHRREAQSRVSIRMCRKHYLRPKLPKIALRHKRSWSSGVEQHPFLCGQKEAWPP